MSLLIILSVVVAVAFGGTPTASPTTDPTTHPTEDAMTCLTMEIRDAVESINMTYNNGSEEITCGIYNLSETSVLKIETAFDTFDSNGNDKLSFEEWVDLTIKISKLGDDESFFTLIDSDNDDIWSFREMTLFLQAFDNSSINISGSSNYNAVEASSRQALKTTVFETLLVPMVSNRYGNTYNYSSGDIEWYEYAAAVLFTVYDNHYNGYVTYEDYIYSTAISSFVNVDTDSDNGISINEFIESMFSIGTLQFLSILNVFDHMDNIVPISDNSSFWERTSATSVANKDIYDCPNMNLVTSHYYDSGNGNGSQRRRLGKLDCIIHAVGCGAIGVACAIAIWWSGGTAGVPCAIGISAECAKAIAACFC